MDFADVLLHLALYLDLGAMFGLTFFALYALRPQERTAPFGQRLLARDWPGLRQRGAAWRCASRPGLRRPASPGQAMPS